MSFKLHDDIGDLLRDAVEAYDKGELGGVIIFMKKGDETWTNSAGMSFIERLGAVELLREDMRATANTREDDEV
jgi:hypothetical protein